MTPREQHLATRRSAGVFDFSFMGLFEFRGRAALDRLQSRDLSAIEPGGEEASLRAQFSDVAACSFEAANSLRIEAGYVLFDREIDGCANPAELGLGRLAPRRSFATTRKLVGLEIEEGYASPDLPS